MDFIQFKKDFNVSTEIGKEQCNVVYFLLNGSDVVYVGVSTMWGYYARLKAHVKDKEFSSSEFIRINLGRRDSEFLEGCLISLFKPKYNIDKMDFNIRQIKTGLDFIEGDIYKLTNMKSNNDLVKPKKKISYILINRIVWGILAMLFVCAIFSALFMIPVTALGLDSEFFRNLTYWDVYVFCFFVALVILGLIRLADIANKEMKEKGLDWLSQQQKKHNTV